MCPSCLISFSTMSASPTRPFLSSMNEIAWINADFASTESVFCSTGRYLYSRTPWESNWYTFSRSENTTVLPVLSRMARKLSLCSKRMLSCMLFISSLSGSSTRASGIPASTVCIDLLKSGSMAYMGISSYEGSAKSGKVSPMALMGMTSVWLRISAPSPL